MERKLNYKNVCYMVHAMKKFFCTALLALVGLLGGRLAAQTVATAPANVVFEAVGSEVFALYVDGMPSGSIAYEDTRQQVTLTGLTVGVHDITVRLIRPTDRVVHVALEYRLQPILCQVSYDAATGRLSVSAEAVGALAAAQAPTLGVAQTVPTTAESVIVTEPVVTPLPHTVHRHAATDADVLDLTARMKKTTFESDKLQLAKSFVKGKHVSTQQAVSIARELRFESKRLDFLLYAFDYCVDRENYYTAADVLAFNGNKQKLLKRIEVSNPRPVSRPTRRPGRR